MARLFARSSWSHLVPLAVLAALCTGCGDGQAPVTSASSQFKPADVSVAPSSGTTTGTIPDTAAASPDQAEGAADAVKQPAAIAVDKLDVESMPDGPPAKILAYMKQMERYEPRGVTRDQQRSDLIRVLHLVVEAGDRVLMHPDATEDERREGAGLKLGGLSKLAQLGEPKADLELIAFATRLKKDKSPGVARVGRLVLFSVDAAKLQNGDVEDPEPILNELQALLEGDDEEHVVFEIGKQTAIVLVQIGQNKAAGRVFKMLGTKYANDPKPEIANEAKQLLKQVKLVELDFPKKFNDLFGDDAKPDAANELLAVIKILLDDPTRDASELTVAAMTADRLERTDHYGPAGEVLDLIEVSFKDHPTPELKEQVEETVVSGRKRLQLIGKPLPLSGLLLDGQPLDVAALQGKIVLIDFWATWCDPCLAEIPNIKACYEKYHDKGFEVIGYNLDKDRADVDRFFANQKLPWPTVVSDAKGKDGFTSPLAEFCGVKSIPFLVLLDGEGKVIALHTRGERLEKKLAELFDAPAK